MLVVGASLPFFANWISDQLSSASERPSARCTWRDHMAREDRTEKTHSQTPQTRA